MGGASRPPLGWALVVLDALELMYLLKCIDLLSTSLLLKVSQNGA